MSWDRRRDPYGNLTSQQECDLLAGSGSQQPQMMSSNPSREILSPLGSLDSEVNLMIDTTPISKPMC